MKITVGIYDEHKLTGIGIRALLNDTEDIDVVFACNEKYQLESTLKNSPVNVFVINIHNADASISDLFQLARWNNPRVKMLVISALSSEEVVLKIIKAGANGFLSREAGRKELLEAVYTLRNGHDYFSNSITHLLVNRYVHKIKENQSGVNQTDISSLSNRQIEILKLWGESHSNQEIADKLFISIRTVESHKNHIMQKLNLKTTVDMVKFAIKNNLIEV